MQATFQPCMRHSHVHLPGASDIPSAGRAGLHVGEAIVWDYQAVYQMNRAWYYARQLEARGLSTAPDCDRLQRDFGAGFVAKRDRELKKMDRGLKYGQKAASQVDRAQKVFDDSHPSLKRILWTSCLDVSVLHPIYVYFVADCGTSPL